MGIPINYSLRGLWVRRATTFGTAFGISLVVFVLASSLMLADGLEQTLTTAGTPGKVIVMSQDAFDESTSRITQDLGSLVQGAALIKKNADGTPMVSGEAVVHVYLSRSGDPSQISSIQLRGVPANAFDVRHEARIVEGRAIRSGTAEAVVGQGLLGRYPGVELGGSIELQKGQKANIVGVLAANGSAYESEVWVDLDTLRTAFGSVGYFSSVTATLSSPGDFDRLKADLESDPRRGLKVERESGYYERVSSRLGSAISGLGVVVSTIFSLGALLGAMITMYGSVDQRYKEIGTLRALGFSRVQVSVAFILEAGALALCGGVAGVAFALLTPLVRFVTINYATGQEVAFHFLPSTNSIVMPLLVGLAVGVLGGLLPALKASSGNPVEALRAPQ